MSVLTAIADLIKSKAWDGDGVPLEESNCAGIGSDEDKALRKAAAETEPAWQDITPGEYGMWIWRVEQFQIVPWPREKYGKFHVGDAYIVLNVGPPEEEEECEDDSPTRDIYFWLGKDAAIDERGVAAYKTVELDDYYDGGCTHHREVMKKESSAFQDLFAPMGGVRYLPGGVESGFEAALPDMHKSELWKVWKNKKSYIVTEEVTLEKPSLNHRDCFVLEAEEKIYVWFGNGSNPYVRLKCNEFAKSIRDDVRSGRSEVVHDCEDAPEFWELLGAADGEGITPAEEVADDDEDPDFGDGILYKIWIDDERQVQVEQVGRRDLDKSMLDTTCVMMLYTRTEILLWIGRKTTELERRNPTRYAIQYLKSNRLSMDMAISVIKEGRGYKNRVWADIFWPGGYKSVYARMSTKTWTAQDEQDAQRCAGNCTTGCSLM